MCLTSIIIDSLPDIGHQRPRKDSLNESSYLLFGFGILLLNIILCAGFFFVSSIDSDINISNINGLSISFISSSCNELSGPRLIIHLV